VTALEPTEGTTLGLPPSDSEAMSEIDADTEEAPGITHGMTMGTTYRAHEDGTPMGLGGGRRKRDGAEAPDGRWGKHQLPAQRPRRIT
jgi:hypothetical protein